MTLKSTKTKLKTTHRKCPMCSEFICKECSSSKKKLKECIKSK